jgi:hypothetical protein
MQQRPQLTFVATGWQELLGDEAAKVGQSRAFKNKWIAKEGAGFVKAVSSSTIPLP